VVTPKGVVGRNKFVLEIDGDGPVSHQLPSTKFYSVFLNIQKTVPTAFSQITFSTDSID
jgi:hypothetical protein